MPPEHVGHASWPEPASNPGGGNPWSFNFAHADRMSLHTVFNTDRRLTRQEIAGKRSAAVSCSHLTFNVHWPVS